MGLPGGGQWQECPAETLVGGCPVVQTCTPVSHPQCQGSGLCCMFSGSPEGHWPPELVLCTFLGLFHLPGESLSAGVAPAPFLVLRLFP